MDRLCEVTRADWGWYTTFTDNLPKLVTFAGRRAGPVPDRALCKAGSAPSWTRWTQAAKTCGGRPARGSGAGLAWYELPEEVAGNRHG